MKKEEIINLLKLKHDNLFDWLNAQGDKYWDYGLPGKWNTGQIVLHLIQTENALNKGLKTPKFLLRYQFGKPNRTPRTYDEIVTNYKNKLVTLGADVVSPYSQDMTLTEDKSEHYIKMLKDEHHKMIHLLEKKWDDKSLVKYLFPHPLMGRMHVAEIMQWTSFHTEHHFLQIKNRAENKV